MTFELRDVQRLFRRQAPQERSLDNRRKLWRLHRALRSTPHATLKPSAQAFGHFVLEQDNQRIAELTQQVRSQPQEPLAPGVVAEVVAISKGSPSKFAQHKARALLATPQAFELPAHDLRTPPSAAGPAQAVLAQPGAPAARKNRAAPLGTPPQAEQRVQTFVAPARTRKIKLVPELYARSSVAECHIPATLKVRKLECEHGTTYWMSQTQTQGSFGKFRRGVDQDGRSVGIKEMRLERAHKEGNSPKKGRSYTTVSSIEDINQEVGLILALGGRIKMHDLAPIDGKVYLVMTGMAGGLDMALREVTRQDRRAVARNVMAQCSERLAHIHGMKRYAHLDLKIDNVLLDDDGHLAPIDFGKSLPIRKDFTSAYWQAGTYPSPEMPYEESVGAPSDVWALGVMFAMAHDGRFGRPFEFVDDEQTRAERAFNFEFFYHSVNDPQTRVVDEARMDPNDRSFGTIFTRLLQYDPQAGPFVLHRMLDPDMTRKATMAEVHAFFANLEAQDPQEKAAALTALSTAAQRIGGTAISQALQGVRQWDLARQSDVAQEA